MYRLMKDRSLPYVGGGRADKTESRESARDRARAGLGPGEEIAWTVRALANYHRRGA
jgi:hypothetical protein